MNFEDSFFVLLSLFYREERFVYDNIRRLYWMQQFFARSVLKTQQLIIMVQELNVMAYSLT